MEKGFSDQSSEFKKQQHVVIYISSHWMQTLSNWSCSSIDTKDLFLRELLDLTHPENLNGQWSLEKSLYIKKTLKYAAIYGGS